MAGTQRPGRGPFRRPGRRIVPAPDDLRARFARQTPAALVAGIASLRPRPGDVPGYAVRVALCELGRRAVFLDGQLERLDELIVPLVTARAPGLLALHGIGPNTAALLLIAAGDHPGRLRSEAAWAHLCGVAPIPASSGKVTRHRLNLPCLVRNPALPVHDPFSAPMNETRKCHKPLLLPADMCEWLPEDNPVFVVLDAVACKTGTSSAAANDARRRGALVLVSTQRSTHYEEDLAYPGL